MDKTSRDERPVASTEIALSFFTKVIGDLWPAILGVITAGGLALHLSGYVSHQNYLQIFGLRAEDFPRPHEYLVLDGYFSFLDRAAWLVKNALHPQVGVVLLIVTGFVFLVLSARRVETKGPLRWFVRLPTFFRLLIISSWWSIFVYSALLTMILMLSLLLIVPGLMGQSVGQQRGADFAKYIVGGCSKHPCSKLVKSGETIATGHVIAISPERVAFYDASQKVVRTLERDGLELQTPIFIPVALLKE